MEQALLWKRMVHVAFCLLLVAILLFSYLLLHDFFRRRQEGARPKIESVFVPKAGL